MVSDRSMNILDTIKKRRSIRNFKNQEIPQQSIDALIEAIRWAPSAGNLQSRKFYFVFNSDIKNQLDKATTKPGVKARVKKIIKTILNRNFVANAPLVVIACLDRKISTQYGDRGVNLYSIQDVSASVMNMMLTVHELGLGSVWIGSFNEDEIIEALSLPDNLRPIAIIPVGYPAEIPPPPSRISKDDAVEFMK
jgi:nitroreductase